MFTGLPLTESQLEWNQTYVHLTDDNLPEALTTLARIDPADIDHADAMNFTLLSHAVTKLKESTEKNRIIVANVVALLIEKGATAYQDDTNLTPVLQTITAFPNLVSCL